MAVKRTISTARRDEILRHVCQRMVPAQVEGAQGGSRQACKSRFLKAVLDGEGLHIIIETPTLKGRPVTVQKGEFVEVLFQQAGQRLGFRSEVQGKSFCRLSEGVSVSALVISYPNELEVRQRRACYRVSLSAANPCTVTFREVPAVQFAGGASGDENLYSAVIRDISAGGMAIHCQQRLPSRFYMGTRLRLFFQLPGIEDNLNMEAEIRGSRLPKAGGGTILGVQFVNTDKDLRTRKAIDSIQKFVVARQREILKRLKAT